MEDKKTILLAEDEINIRDFVQRGLSNFGYEVEVAVDGNEAWLQLERHANRFQLLILDIRMPVLSGLEVCQKFRERYGYQVPVIMLTALNTTDDVVMGLHVGADEYVIKPFKFMELLARIEALLRRSVVTKTKLQCDDLTCDPSTHKAQRGDVEVELSTKEYRLLEYFIMQRTNYVRRRSGGGDTNHSIFSVYIIG